MGIRIGIFHNTSGLITSMFYLFYVDSMLPVITLNSSVNGSTVLPSASIDFSITDPNLDTALYHWDNSDNLTLEDPFNVTAPATEGWHWLYIHVNDTDNPPSASDGRHQTERYHHAYDDLVVVQKLAGCLSTCHRLPCPSLQQRHLTSFDPLP